MGRFGFVGKPKTIKILHRTKKVKIGKKSEVFQSGAKKEKTNLTSILHLKNDEFRHHPSD